jgi:hypothetical protein
VVRVTISTVKLKQREIAVQRTNARAHTVRQVADDAT